MNRKKDEMNDYVYAIDYGTSNSLMSVVNADGASKPLELDQNALDPSVFRSVLFFPHGNQCFYGQKAVDEYNLNQGEGRLVRSIKKYLPSTNYIGSYIDDRVVKLEDLIGFFLLEMRKRANDLVGADVDKVILGRPAKFSFNPSQDKMAEFRLEKAAKIAGFKEVSFLAEPIAAAFDLRKSLTQMKTVLVVDLGGGTSDFTVIRIGPKEFQESDLLAIGGVSVAGDVIDGSFMKNEIAEFFGGNVQYRVPLGKNIQKMPPILKESIASPADIVQLQKRQIYHFFREVEKWALSESDKLKMKRLMVLVEDQLGFKIYECIDQFKRQVGEDSLGVFQFDYPEIEIQKEISNFSYEQSIGDAVEKILKCLTDTLKQSGLSTDEIDIVYCTGGTSKLQLIQTELAKLFGPEKLSKSSHFHSVIQGLSERAHQIFF